MALTPQTLCYVFRDRPDRSREVLLDLKLSGFGKGTVMGLGGHVDPGESDAAAAIREVREESGIVIDPASVSHRATITYLFPSKPSLDARVAVYFGQRWTGVATESGEIRPRWYPVLSPPLDQMWDDERHWLPLVLAGRFIIADFVYDESCTHVETAHVREVDPRVVAGSRRGAATDPATDP